jgi:hypothetical protein
VGTKATARDDFFSAQPGVVGGCDGGTTRIYTSPVQTIFIRRKGEQIPPHPLLKYKKK